MFLTCLVALVLHADANSPGVWIGPAKGRLVRAGRDGDAQQTFDAYPKSGRLLFRNRQLAFDDGSILTWITTSNGTAHKAIAGKSLIGWRDGEPVLFDGLEATDPSGWKSVIGLHKGDTPVFVALGSGAGVIVSQTSGATLRVELLGRHPISADFGHWALAQARMITASQGFLVLVGNGSAIVRIDKGRADIISIDPERRLGIGLASDGRVYVTRPGDDDRNTTEVMQVDDRGKSDLYCTVAGPCDVIDLDRAKHLLYAVRHSEKGDSYVRIDYKLQQEVILRERVGFVTPAFGGPGFVAAANLADKT